MSTSLLDGMLAAAIAAIDPILAVYSRPIAAMRKQDGSPVTEADGAAEAVILSRLAPTRVPVLAEERVSAGDVPELGDRFFVVDPLDGTKEFLKRNGEFTINVALCEAGRPTLGVIIAPVTGLAFWGSPDGAFRGRVAGDMIVDRQRIAVTTDGPLRIVASRSHGHAALADLCRTMAVAEDVSVGSSLKFCLLAEGVAQLYPRFTPTCEWDTAAGQAIVQAAGGVVLGRDGAPLTCGHADRSFLNGFFVAAATRDLAEATLAEMNRLLPPEATGPAPGST